MVSVRLDVEMERQLDYFASRYKVSKSKLIKNSLVHYFDMLQKKERKKTPYELGSDLFGKYASGKGDLSTTYKQKIKEKLHAKNTHR